MAVDANELAAVLEELRLERGNEKKEHAARRIGMSERQYRRLSNAHEDNPQTETLEKIARAYGIQLGWLMDRITHGDNTLTGRLQRLEDQVDAIHQAVAEILEIQRQLGDLLPGLDELASQAAPTSGRASRPKQTRARPRAAS